MSRVLIILVEGETEKDFVNNSIYQYLSSLGITNVRPITIETSPGFKGGDVRYEARYKSNVLKLLRGKEEMIVTSLIDFYKLRSDFPKYEEAQKIKDVSDRVSFLENACFEDIGDNRFIPYIQLHEFEGLLFTEIKGFKSLPDITAANIQQLADIVSAFPNPELINEGKDTAPSKRLIKLIPSYQKPLYGNFIALENDFNSILSKCPRFKAWIDKIVERMLAK